MNIPGVYFLIYLEQASEQVYKKTFKREIDQAVKTTPGDEYTGVVMTPRW
jgi:hypothetical protein